MSSELFLSHEAISLTSSSPPATFSTKDSTSGFVATNRKLFPGRNKAATAMPVRSGLDCQAYKFGG